MYTVWLFSPCHPPEVRPRSLFVGESYIHGLMDGAAVNQQSLRDTFEEREFILECTKRPLTSAQEHGSLRISKSLGVRIRSFASSYC